MRLTVEDLSGERGGETVFAGVGFSLEAGGALLVTGPNGAGKTTLLRVVAGLLPARSGRVVLAAAGERLPLGECAHYLGHLNGMKATLTVSENLRFWQRYLAPGAGAAVPIGEALDEVGLGAIGHLPFGYLSTGQKRRAAIARLLVAPRPVWLLDEPTAGLDAGSAAAFADLLARHLAGGGLAVAVTHQPLPVAGARTLALEPAHA